MLCDYVVWGHFLSVAVAAYRFGWLPGTSLAQLQIDMGWTSDSFTQYRQGKGVFKGGNVHCIVVMVHLFFPRGVRGYIREDMWTLISHSPLASRLASWLASRKRGHVRRLLCLWWRARGCGTVDGQCCRGGGGWSGRGCPPRWKGPPSDWYDKVI